MTNETAAARIARITARLSGAALAAFIAQEKEILRDLNGWAFFHGGPSESLKAQNAALTAYLAR